MIYETRKERHRFYKLLMPTLNNIEQSKGINEIYAFDFNTVKIWRDLLNDYASFLTVELSESNTFENVVMEERMAVLIGLYAIIKFP